MTRHLRIVGPYRTDRLRQAALAGPAVAVAHCHQRLRGPYTGVDTVLAAVLPEAARRWPELVEQHRVELLYGIPELAELIGPPPRTLAAESPFSERTRFFGSGMVRCMSQGIVSFLLGYARRVRDDDDHRPPTLVVFDGVHAAEPTTRELIALLVRRADADVLRAVVCGAADSMPDELEQVLVAHCDRVDVDAAPPPAGDHSAAELVAAYVGSDGTSEDPDESAAYHAAGPTLVRRLHDERADALEPGAGWSTRVGAVAYHREHGSDPGGAGRRALLAALRYCVGVGFSAMVVDLGLRGRAVTDAGRHQRDFCEFTNQAAAAMVPLGRLDESLRLYLDLRHRYPLPKVHMTTSYAIAMLYTRFFDPRDHEEAVRWQNNAIAIASVLPEPSERLVFGVFQDNGMALIQMHRGNLVGALELVEAGIARLDANLSADRWVLHRSQLLYNRARLLVALGRLDEAYVDYATLIDLDPYYTDYLSERARISRKRGDFEAALADYDRAVALAPPFPELYFNRGTARAQVGDLTGARADFEYVLAMEPDDVETRLSRIELELGAGELDCAEAEVDAGLSLRDREPRLWCMKGVIRLERGDAAGALDALAAALAIDPRYPAALVNRAVAYFELGQHHRSVDDLSATLEIAGDDPDVLLNRGLAYRAEGRGDLAIADFDRALQLPDADVPELRYQRGLCLIGTTEHSTAVADLQECQRLGGHAEEIDRLLAGI